MNIVQFSLVFLIRLYQKLVSPLLPAIFGPSACCRFTPTCSQYACDAIRLHGAILGAWLAARRLGRCHPWGDCGDDPPPSAPLQRKSASRFHGFRFPSRNPNPNLNPNPDPSCAEKIKIKIRSKIRRATQNSEVRLQRKRRPLKARPSGICHGS